MSIGLGSQTLVGLDIGPDVVKAVVLKQTRRGWHLVKHGLTLLPEASIVDREIKKPAAVSETIKTLFRQTGITAKRVAFSVGGAAVMIKRIQLPLMDEWELEEQITQEAEAYIPFDLKEIHLDFQIIQHDEALDTMEVLLVGCRRSIVDPYQEVMNSAGLTLSLVDADSFCIENAYRLLIRSQTTQTNQGSALVHIGAKMITMIILSETEGLSVQEQFFGGCRLGDMVNPSKESFVCTPEYRTAILEPFLSRLSDRLMRSLRLHEENREENLPVKEIILSGECAVLEGVQSYLADTLGVPLHLADPLGMGPRFMIAAGLALRNNP